MASLLFKKKLFKSEENPIDLTTVNSYNTVMFTKVKQHG